MCDEMDVSLRPTKRGLSDDEEEVLSPVTSKLIRTSSTDSIASTSTTASNSTTRQLPPPAAENEGQDVKCPPIVMDVPKNWAQHASTMNQLVRGDFRITSSGRTLRIRTTTVPHFRCLQRYLQSENLPFHTFPLPQERPLLVIIKGLPALTDPTDITDALNLQGFAVKEVKALRRDGGRETGLWMVSLPPVPRNQRNVPPRPPTEVYTIKTLLFCKVDIQRKGKNQGPSQCHRCQRFGHSSPQCSYHPRCVRCGDSHSPPDCPLGAEDRGPCANCSGPHNANYRGCPAFKAEKQRLAARQTHNRTAPPRKTTQVSKIQKNPSPAWTPLPAGTDNGDVGSDAPLDEEPQLSFAEVVKRRKRKARNPANRDIPLRSSHKETPVLADPPAPAKQAESTEPSPTAPVSQHHPSQNTRKDPRTAPRTSNNSRPTQTRPQPAPATPSQRAAIPSDVASILQQVMSQLALVTGLLKSLVAAIIPHHG